MAVPETPSPAGHDRDPMTASSPALVDALFANASMGLAHWDGKLRFQRINGLLAAINGLPVEAHLGRRPSEILPGIGTRLEEMLERVLRSGEVLRAVEITGETPAAPGITRHWVADYFPVRDASGVTIGVTGLVAEVTGERRAEFRAEEALRRSAFVDAELHALYSALPVGVAFLSPELRYRRVNETLARMNERSIEEHIGHSLEEVLGSHADELTPALRRVLDTREPLELEFRAPHSDDPDTVRAYEATYFPVVDAHAELLGVGGVVRELQNGVPRDDIAQVAIQARGDDDRPDGTVIR